MSNSDKIMDIIIKEQESLKTLVGSQRDTIQEILKITNSIHLQVEDLKKQASSLPPGHKRYIVSQSTIENIANVVQDFPRFQLLVDEYRGSTGISFGEYKQLQEQKLHSVTYVMRKAIDIMQKVEMVKAHMDESVAEEDGEDEQEESWDENKENFFTTDEF